MITREYIEQLIEKKPDYRDLVFQRGFLITNCETSLNEISLCKDWRKIQFGSYLIWLHPNTDFHVSRVRGNVFFIIGHAYDPLKGLFREEDILSVLSSAYDKGSDSYQSVIDELTGVFLTGVIEGQTLRYQADAVSMYVSYSGIAQNHFFLSSHCNLIGCVAGLTRDKYVDELVAYKYYKYFGIGLPGDLSPYHELKRTQANFEYVFDGNALHFSRIFPRNRIEPESYPERIQTISSILEKNMDLIWLKWGKNAALGLTGGRDSTTSLAGAHALLPSLETFSYVSSEGEQYDASAAEEIAKKIHVSHTTYHIDLSDSEASECEDIGSIIEFNMGSIGRIRDVGIRRRVYFYHHPAFHVEIKSWVDEIGRARLHKRYLKNSFPKKLRPRHLTTIYKVFGFNRKLVRKTDNAFSAYLKKYYSDDVLDRIPWWDLIYWEYLWGENEALHLLNEHMLTYEVTIPFNNRCMLKAMLEVELNKRINDSIQIDVIESLLPEINRTGIHVKDFGWNRKREIAERIYWEVQTRLPF